jgi:hypothetical protein
MKSSFFSAHAGAIISTLGALLALCGYLLLLRLGVLILAPALIVLAMSAYCWFWKVGRVFLIVSLILIGLALLWHGYLTFLYAVFRCFSFSDMPPPCPPVSLGDIFGLGLPYVGYLLSGFGLVIAAQQSKTGKAVSVSKQD